MISQRQHQLLYWLRYESARRHPHGPQAEQIAAALNWKYPNTTKILRALHKDGLVEYAQRQPGDEHYIQRHKTSYAGMMYLVTHK